MIEFSPVCQSSGEVCPVKEELINIMARREALVAALLPEIFTQFDRRQNIQALTDKGVEILRNADANCDGQNCLVVDGLSEEFINLDSFRRLEE